MVRFEIVFFRCRVILIQASFVMNEFQRPPLFSRIYKALVVLIKSKLQILSEPGIEFHVLLALQNIGIIHGENLLSGTKGSLYRSPC